MVKILYKLIMYQGNGNNAEHDHLQSPWGRKVQGQSETAKALLWIF